MHLIRGKQPAVGLVDAKAHSHAFCYGLCVARKHYDPFYPLSLQIADSFGCVFLDNVCYYDAAFVVVVNCDVHDRSGVAGVFG